MNNSVSTRPLGDLSTFVVEEMPYALKAGVDQSLYEESESLAVSQLQRDIDPASSKLAILDLTMLERAVAMSSPSVGPNLHELTNRTAKVAQSKPGLTYEGLIHSNPLEDDPRTFTTGDIVASEMLFYDVHRCIERQLAQTQLDVQAALYLEDSIDSCRTSIATVQKGFRRLLYDLSSEHFIQMRDYFSNDHRRMPGPSALFSAGMYCLDTHLLGDDPDMQQFLDEKMRLADFYPTSDATQRFCGLSDMQEARQSQHLAVQKSSAYSEALSEMIRTRSTHLGVAKKFIPEVFAGDGTGTGLTSAVRMFLEKPLHIYHKAYEK